MSGKPYIGTVVSVAELAAMRAGGEGGELVPWTSIGEQVGYSDDAVRRYGNQVLSPELLGRARRRVRGRVRSVEWEDRGGCTRCGFHGWDRNPITLSERCLWCEIELAGIDLREACQSGLMAEMIEAVRAGACPEPVEGASDGD